VEPPPIPALLLVLRYVREPLQWGLAVIGFVVALMAEALTAETPKLIVLAAVCIVAIACVTLALVRHICAGK
jgi:hypothetical protein